MAAEDTVGLKILMIEVYLLVSNSNARERSYLNCSETSNIFGVASEKSHVVDHLLKFSDKQNFLCHHA